MRFNGQVIALGSTHRAEPAAGEVSSLDPPASVVSIVPASTGLRIDLRCRWTDFADIRRTGLSSLIKRLLFWMSRPMKPLQRPVRASLSGGSSTADRQNWLTEQLIRLVTMVLGKSASSGGASFAGGECCTPERSQDRRPRSCRRLFLWFRIASSWPEGNASDCPARYDRDPGRLEEDVPVAADRGGVEGPVFVQLGGPPRPASPPDPRRVNRSVACVRAEIEARKSVELPLRCTAMRLTDTKQPIT